ncbi:MAG: MotA/TolQ/ExbB proton channel family protein [Planctomycetota bacterium]|jgi:biopolymer transport protein ExbB
MRRYGRAAVVLVAVGVVVGVLFARAAWAGAAPTEVVEDRTFLDNIKAGGPIGYTIILLSVAGLALMIEHAVSLRREKLIPPYILSELENLFDEEEYEEAMDLCDQEDSMLARVVGAGLAKIGGGYAQMKEAIEEVSEEEATNLTQKISYLSLISGVAPMLGLLGTVKGMIEAFDKIAVMKGATNPSDLADSISKALITTFLGLVVAIPTTAGYMFFRNKVMKLSQEASAITGELIDRFRRVE